MSITNTVCHIRTVDIHTVKTVVESNTYSIISTFNQVTNLIAQLVDDKHLLSVWNACMNVLKIFLTCSNFNLA